MWDLLQIARWMHIDPEILLNKSLYWFDWGLAGMQADQAVQQEQERKTRNAWQKQV